MSCDHLVCASCGGVVADGRCGACRASRAHLHHHGTLPTQLLVALAVVAALLAVVLQHAA